MMQALDMMQALGLVLDMGMELGLRLDMRVVSRLSREKPRCSDGSVSTKPSTYRCYVYLLYIYCILTCLLFSTLVDTRSETHSALSAPDRRQRSSKRLPRPVRRPARLLELATSGSVARRQPRLPILAEMLICASMTTQRMLLRRLMCIPRLTVSWDGCSRHKRRR
jgi:hypothetical protein